MHRTPHKPLKEIKSTEKLQLVHSDICGPMQTKSFGGSRHFITFTDDYSRCCKSYFLKEKSEALEKFKEFKAAVEKESGKSIKALRADRGGEYLSEEFSCYLKKHGIRAEFTAAYSPQQNGVSERMNRTLVEAARSMITHAGLSNAYGAEAVATAVYLCNRMITTALKSGETPYQRWYGKKPNLQHIRVFGCMVYTHVPDNKAQKLRFIGYTNTATNYKVWDEKKRRCYIRHDVVFNESDFGKPKQSVSTKPDEGEKQAELELEVKTPEQSGSNEEQQVQEESEEQEEPDVRRSQRVTKPVIRYGIDDFADISNVEAQHVAFRASKIDKPTTIEEMLNTSH